MTWAQPATRLNARTRVFGFALAVGLPILVGALFGHPARQVLVPESIMLAIAVVLSLLYGVAVGLVTAASATVSLWFFNFPPGLSFRVANGEDLVAAFAAGAITCALVLLVSRIERRRQVTAAQEARLAAELERQRITIVTMQRAILPEVVPETPGVRLAWQYVVGGDDAAPVGGDWFAFIPITPNSVGVAIGDVSGHGLDAVRSMAEYRYALRTLATEDAAPDITLNRLDDITSMFRAPYFSSCIYGVVNLARSSWTYTSAGHPPPLLLRNREVHMLTAPHGPPLGTGFPSAPFTSDAVSLQPGDLIALYTDGLIERRREHFDTGIQRLAEQLSTRPTAGNVFDDCHQILDDLAGPHPADDAALVLVHYDNPLTP